MYEIAARVEALRQHKGWTKAELAKRARLHPQHIYKVLSGERSRIEAATIRALALAFTVSSDYLLGLTDDQTPHQPNLQAPRSRDLPPKRTRKAASVV
jgi:transcriptional regulator with XRE-family HTH domain